MHRLLTASLQCTRNFSITLIASGLEKSVSSPRACKKVGGECVDCHVNVGKITPFQHSHSSIVCARYGLHIRCAIDPVQMLMRTVKHSHMHYRKGAIMNLLQVLRMNEFEWTTDRQSAITCDTLSKILMLSVFPWLNASQVVTTGTCTPQLIFRKKCCLVFVEPHMFRNDQCSISKLHCTSTVNSCFFTKFPYECAKLINCPSRLKPSCSYTWIQKVWTH